jgi:hypothetical protein
MTFRGAREQSVDYFDDILGNNRDAGVFQGLGIDDYDRVQQQIAAEGVTVGMNCRSCNKRSTVTVTWEELYYVGANGGGQPLVLPAGWSKSDENLDCYVQLQCGRCHNMGFAPHFTPDEARALIQQAANSGFVNPQQVAAWKQKIAMYRGAAG